MIFPLVQKVTAELVSTLQRVKRPQYNFNVAVRVASFAAEAMGGHDAEAVLRLDNFNVLNSDEGAPIGHDDWDQTYKIAVLVRTADDSELLLHDKMLMVAADIERAVMQDYTRGGNAILTTFAGGELLDYQEEGFYGIDLTFVVRIRTQMDDPYQTHEATES